MMNVTDEMASAAAKILNERLASGVGLHGVSRDMIIAALSASPVPAIDAEGVERLGTIDKDIAKSILSGNSEITRIASGEWSPQSVQLYVDRATLRQGEKS